jgi:hypothetical protein
MTFFPSLSLTSCNLQSGILTRPFSLNPRLYCSCSINIKPLNVPHWTHQTTLGRWSDTWRQPSYFQTRNEVLKFACLLSSSSRQSKYAFIQQELASVFTCDIFCSCCLSRCRVYTSCQLDSRCCMAHTAVHLVLFLSILV